MAARGDASVTTSGGGSGSHWDEALRITSALPLVECQLHLSSSVPPEWLSTRAAGAGLALQPTASARLGPHLRAQRGFSGASTWVLQCLQTERDLREAVAAVVFRCASEGVTWLELHVCPHHHTTGGKLSLREVVACACAGFKAAATGTNLDGGLVLVVNAPEQSVGDAHTTVTLAAQHGRQGVLGVQLSASGHCTDLAPYHSVASSVVAAELPLSIHASDGPCAGSSGGPDGTQELQVALRNVGLALEVGACRLSGAHCLRHGGSAQQQAAIAAATPLIVCLTHSCRAREQGWPRFAAQHPIGGMLAAGLVCVPAVGHALLTEQPWHEGASPGAVELAHLVASCGLTWPHVRALLLHAAAATLMAPQLKATWLSRYQERLDAALARVGAPGMGGQAALGQGRSLHGVQHSPQASPEQGLAHAVARVFVNTDAVSRPQDDPALLLRRSALMPRGSRFKPGDGSPQSPQAASPGEGGSPGAPQGRAPSPPPREASREVSTVPPRWALSLPAPRSGEDAWQGGRYNAGAAGGSQVQNAMSWLKMDDAAPAKPPAPAPTAPRPAEHRPPPAAAAQQQQQQQQQGAVDVESAAVAAARRIADKRGVATLQRPLPPVALRPQQQGHKMASPSTPKTASPPAAVAPSPPLPPQQWPSAVASAPASPSDQSYTLPIRGKLSEKRRLQQLMAAMPIAMPPTHVETVARTLGVPLPEARAPVAAPAHSGSTKPLSPGQLQAPPAVMPAAPPAAAPPPPPALDGHAREPPVSHAAALSRTAAWASSTAAVLMGGLPQSPQASGGVANGTSSPGHSAQTGGQDAASVRGSQGWADDPSGVQFAPVDRAPAAPAQGPYVWGDGADDEGAWKLLSAPMSKGERARMVGLQENVGVGEDDEFADGGF
jgi:adenosine deaminase